MRAQAGAAGGGARYRFSSRTSWLSFHEEAEAKPWQLRASASGTHARLAGPAKAIRLTNLIASLPALFNPSYFSYVRVSPVACRIEYLRQITARENSQLVADQIPVRREDTVSLDEVSFGQMRLY
jgi:hypothetical protein